MKYLVPILVALAVTVIIFVAALRHRDIKRKPKKWIFGYELFYSDAKNSRRDKRVIFSKLLVSERYGLSGKPDCILKRRYGKALVPIEYKSGSAELRDAPFDGDLMQLTAYFLIIEDYFGVRPRFGRIIYRDAMFQIRNTRMLRNAVLTTVENMKGMLEGTAFDAEPSFAKCRYCVCRMTVCEHCDNKDD